MPLSAAADREHIHTRNVECRGYRRTDGLWDVEGHLTDVKAYPFTILPIIMFIQYSYLVKSSSQINRTKCLILVKF